MNQPLSEQERLRYARQIAIPGWSEQGQSRLRQVSVGVAGTGGLGCSILLHLVSAGFGRVVLVDRDRVELTNLNRQILHWEPDVGRNKTRSAAEKLAKLNSRVELESHAESLTASSVDRIFSGVDAVVDGLDSFAGRRLINGFAVRRRIPLFHGAVWGLEGRAMTVLPGESACLECLYPNGEAEGGPADDGDGVAEGASAESAAGPTAAAGVTPVAGVTPALVAAVQVAEAIKYFLGLGELLAGRLLVYDGTGMRFFEVEVERSPQCPACGAPG